MLAEVIQYESIARLSVFLTVLAVMAIAEALLPRRRRVLPRVHRWFTNLSIVGFGAVVTRVLAVLSSQLVLPLVAVVAAALAARQGWGVLNGLDWPTWLEMAVAIVVLDFAIWFQHWASHRVPALWQIHQVHHADRDIDVTTALRFHPVEIGLSMLYKVAWVMALGASPAAVIIFEITLNALAMFNHANVALPLRLDRLLRTIIVTPDMHRVHHSVHLREHNNNFGFNLSVWDRLFSTYTAQPKDGHDGMTIGLPEYQSAAPARLGWSLGLPFGLVKRDQK